MPSLGNRRRDHARRRRKLVPHGVDALSAPGIGLGLGAVRGCAERVRLVRPLYALAHVFLFEDPTLVIVRPSDPIHPFSDADRIERKLPNAQLVTASSILECRGSAWTRRTHPRRSQRLVATRSSDRARARVRGPPRVAPVPGNVRELRNYIDRKYLYKLLWRNGLR